MLLIQNTKREKSHSRIIFHKNESSYTISKKNMRVSLEKFHDRGNAFYEHYKSILINNKKYDFGLYYNFVGQNNYRAYYIDYNFSSKREFFNQLNESIKNATD